MSSVLRNLIIASMGRSGSGDGRVKGSMDLPPAVSFFCYWGMRSLEAGAKCGERRAEEVEQSLRRARETE
jgi:hypothetical protein